MKGLLVWFFAAAFFIAAAAAWTKEDYEIFDLVTALEAAEGKRTTFYSWLDVSPTATIPEINKAYRRKSIQLHPDKNPGVKGAHERFARLGVIAAILRSSEGRERYDFFHKNGVPRWRGTGYYYSRFRPGLGTVLVFLTALSSILQYVVQSLNYKRDLARVERVRSDARAVAWGPKMIPVEGQRKVKVSLAGRDESGQQLGGQYIDVVVDTSNVYLLDGDGTMHVLDASTAVPASWTRTWFLGLVISLYQRFQTATPKEDGAPDGSESDAIGETDDDGASDAPGKASARDGLKARNAAVKTGGKRRKTVRKR